MEIRNNPATADIPVIMLTAKTQDLAKILAFKQGVQQYVTKPFNILELSARVREPRRSRPRRRRRATGGAEGEFRKLAVRKGGRTVLLDHRRHRLPLGEEQVDVRAHVREPVPRRPDARRARERSWRAESFARVHRSYMVNLNKVKEILRVDGSYVVVAADRDETHIPVARRQVQHVPRGGRHLAPTPRRLRALTSPSVPAGDCSGAGMRPPRRANTVPAHSLTAITGASPSSPPNETRSPTPLPTAGMRRDGGRLGVDDADRALVGDDAGDRLGGRVAGDGDHVEADRAHAGHRLELLDA